MIAIFEFTRQVAAIIEASMRPTVEWSARDDLIAGIDNYYFLIGVTLVVSVVVLIIIVRALRPNDRPSRGWFSILAGIAIVAPPLILIAVATSVRVTGIPF